METGQRSDLPRYLADSWLYGVFLVLYKRLSLNSLPNDVIKLKAFADDKILVNVAHMMISVFDTVRNIVGKEENAGYQHFLLFPRCFQNTSCLGRLKQEQCIL